MSYHSSCNGNESEDILHFDVLVEFSIEYDVSKFQLKKTMLITNQNGVRYNFRPLTPMDNFCTKLCILLAC